jgi:hypothetical protein
MNCCITPETALSISYVRMTCRRNYGKTIFSAEKAVCWWGERSRAKLLFYTQ